MQPSRLEDVNPSPAVFQDPVPGQIGGRPARKIHNCIDAAKGATDRARATDIGSGYATLAVSVKVNPRQHVVAAKAFPQHTADQPRSTCHEYTHQEGSVTALPRGGEGSSRRWRRQRTFLPRRLRCSAAEYPIRPMLES